MNNLSMEILTPPLLVTKSEDEWYRWVEEQMAGQDDFKMPGKDTISGKLILTYAPVWGQADAIRRALTGELKTPQAEDILTRFLQGSPLSLLPFGSAERFRNFVPVLVRKGDNTYQAGLEPGIVNEFQAESPGQALDRGRRWFLFQRDKEINAMLNKAREISKGLGGFFREVLGSRLRGAGELLAETPDGAEETVVSINGAHDRYVVYGADYTYGFSASSPIAAVTGLMAAKGRGFTVPKPGDNDLKFVAPPGWASGEENVLYEWKNGQVTRDGTVTHNGVVKGKMLWKNGKFTLFDSNKKEVVSLPSPERPQNIMLAWGCSLLAKQKS